MTGFGTGNMALLPVILALGYVLGLFHFRTLHQVTALLLRGNPFGVALQLARMCLLVVVLWGVAQVGPLALIAGLAGILLARAQVLRAERAGP